MANTVINTPELLNLDSTTGATVLAKGTVNERPATPTFSVDYLVVAGGGSSGAAGGGGGGGGGLRTSYGSVTGGGGVAESALNLTAGTSYTWNVGAGGAGVVHANIGNDGSQSTFSSITSTGGGGGGAYPPEGRSGGSGGGCGQSGQRSGGGSGAGGSASSPTQGYPGGSKPTTATVNYVSAGGGGAGAAGGDVPSDVTPGAGGVGLAVNILNSTNATTASVGEVSGGNVYYAGGGGGSNESSSPGAAGGLGGGTNGAAGCPGTAPLAGVANTGGGNGGTGGCGSAYSTGGGSGVIILRYPSVYTATVTGTQASGSPFTEGSDKVSVFTAGTGTISFSGTVVGDENEATDGALRFNTDTNKTEYFGGTGWYEIVDEYASGFAGPGTNYFDTKLYTGNGSTQSIGGYINGSASFNGSSSAIILPNNILSSDFSISAWFYLNNTSGNQYLFEFDYENRVLFRVSSTDNNWAYIGNSGYFNPGITYNAGQWYNVVITFSNGNPFKIYVNSVLSYTGGNTSVSAFSNDNILGAANSSGSGAVNGLIDQVRIYNTELSSSDVTALFNETAATATTAAFPSGQTAIATYTMDTSANGLLTTTDLSTVDYPSGAGCYVLYEMNGNSNDTNNTYNGTPTNITYQGGAFDQAAVFNGSNSKIDTGIASISSPFSVSMWINEDVLNSGVFFGNWNSTSADMYWQTTSDGRLRISIDGFSQQFFGTAGDVTAKTWHHIAVALGSGVYEVYLDGTSLGTSTTSVTTFSSGQNFMIGNSSKPSTPLPFDGLIDQVRIFNTKLTQSQVTTLARGIATSYSGAATNVNFNGHLDFQPDLVWIKQRNGTASHSWQDSVRGAGQSKNIYSDNTAAEGTYGQYGYLSSFDTNGFTVEAGSGSHTNANGSTYVAWNWKGGGDDVLNEEGTIDSQVSANTEAGFSVVKFTGSLTSGQTVGHGLTEPPSVVILKDLDSVANWYIYHQGTGTTSGYINYLKFDSTAGSYSDKIFYPINFNSTTFTPGNDATVLQGNVIAYCFHSVAGYSKIGSYNGTSSTGNRIYVDSNNDGTGTGGFEPSFVMIKRSNGTGSWFIYDNKRASNLYLSPDLSNIEGTDGGVVFNSDGFTINVTYNDHNTSGGTYIYMAFK